MKDDNITVQDEISRPTINIARAALYLARSLAYPVLNVSHYIARLDALAAEARPHLADSKTLDDRVDALSDFLFNQIKFSGNHDDYNDPRNSFLNCVLDRRMGIPISLSVIYTAVAKRLGMPAYGVGLPGHFIVGVFQGGSQVYLDPFNAGIRLSVADCSRLVRESTGFQGVFQPRWLKPITPDVLLGRMLTNLANSYVHREDWDNGIQAVQHLMMLQPEIDFHLRDLGFLYLYNGSMHLAAQYLEEYLRRVPDASDFEHVRNSLQIVTGRLALWN